jgi:hypothetical protein
MPLGAVSFLAYIMVALVNCSICGKPVKLEEAKVDAVGMPIHEDCYVLAVKREAAAAGSQSRNVPKAR